MFESLFSFSGRMNRSQFIGWSTFQAVLSFGLLAASQGLSVETMSASGIGAPAGNIGIVLVLAIVSVVLPSSALLVKRLRDVGLPAWPCFFMISFVDALFVGIVPHTTGFAEGPFAGLAFTMAVTVLLAFVPGRGSAAESEAGDAHSDWVERAAAAEAKLLEDRRHPKIATDQAKRLDQLQALESIRRQGATIEESDLQGFGRRR